MIIGRFTHNAEQNTYLGDIKTLNFAIERVSVVANDKKGEKEPDYRIKAATAGGLVELGAGWKRKSDKSLEFISVELDSPLLSKPLKAALFSDGKESANLVWSRQKAKTDAAETD